METSASKSVGRISTAAPRKAGGGGGGSPSWLSFSYKLTIAVVFQTQGQMSN